MLFFPRCQVLLLPQIDFELHNSNVDADKRHLGVHLFYTEDCPSDYEPLGFVGGRNEIIKYPFNENWQKDSQPCGTMDGGWHT